MIDVPRFINALTAELQADAWEQGVTLVVDASRPVLAPIPENELSAALTRFLRLIIQSLPERSSVCLMTSFDAETRELSIELTWGAGEGRNLVATREVHAASATMLAAATIDLESSLKSCAGRLERTHETTTMRVVVPDATQTRASSDVPQRTAIVVDDDTDMQEFLCAVLEHEGFRAIPVNDGIAALLAVDRYRPDVVLTDIVMPNLNGLDLIGRIKSFDQRLPVIVFSGYIDALAEHCRKMQNPPDAILPKPVNIDAILGALSSVLAPT